MSATICVRRLNAWHDPLARYKFMVDGAGAGLLRQGASIEVSVPPGHHELWMRFGLWRSPKLDVEISDGDHLDLLCRGNVPPLLVPLYGTLRRSHWIDLRAVS